jgi:hypothetical protein
MRTLPGAKPAHKPKNQIREAGLGTRSRSKIQTHEYVTHEKTIEQQLKTGWPNLGRKQKTGGAVTKLDWPGEPALPICSRRTKLQNEQQLRQRVKRRPGQRKSLTGQTGGQKNCWRLEQKSRKTKKGRRPVRALKETSTRKNVDRNLAAEKTDKQLGKSNPAGAQIHGLAVRAGIERGDRVLAAGIIRNQRRTERQDYI